MGGSAKPSKDAARDVNPEDAKLLRALGERDPRKNFIELEYQWTKQAKEAEEPAVRGRGANLDNTGLLQELKKRDPRTDYIELERQWNKRAEAVEKGKEAEIGTNRDASELLQELATEVIKAYMKR
jgi:hypothetical protein